MKLQEHVHGAPVALGSQERDGGLEPGGSNRTNRANNGRVSEDRSSKATLLLTAPRSSQVVCKGSTPMSEWNCHAWASPSDMFLSPDEPGLSVIG